LTIHNSTSSEYPHLYNPDGIAALATYFCGIPGLTPELCNTPAHAVLCVQKSRNKPQQATQRGGLDSMYLDLNDLRGAQGEGEEEINCLKKATLGDIIDSMCFFFFVQLSYSEEFHSL